MALTSSSMRLVMREIHEVEANPVDGIRIGPSEDLSEIRFELDGPEGTPFELGRFHISLQLGEHYPEVPPRGVFRTRIFHPNVSARGEICVNALKKDWEPSLGLRHILLVIRCLLIEPNPESALNEEAGRLLLEDYAAYERKAMMFTNIHAKRPAGAPRLGLSTGAADGHLPPEKATAMPLRGGGTDVSPPATSPPAGLRPVEGNTVEPEPRSECRVGHVRDPATSPEKVRRKTQERTKAALRRI